MATINNGFLKTVVTITLSTAVKLLNDNKATVLAQLAKENVTLEALIETQVTNLLKAAPSLGVLQTILPQLLIDVKPQLIAAAGSEEDALYAMIIADVQIEAARLTA